MLDKVLKKKVKEAVKKTYDLDFDNFVIEHPNNEKFGDYATNVALGLAAEVKQSPMDIAKKVCYELNNEDDTFSVDRKTYDTFSKIYVERPGFINFVLSDEWLYFVLRKIVSKVDYYGARVSFGDRDAKKLVTLEHTTINPNKAAHIGHLRNACIGQFIERVYTFLGENVDVIYYDNDLGIQVATLLMGVEKITDISPDSYKKYDHYAWDVYARVEEMISEDPALKDERDKITTLLEDEDGPISKKQLEVSEKVLVDQLKTMQNLGIDYDVIVRERDVISMKLWEKAFEELKANENVYLAESGPSKGCWLVKMNTEKTDSEDNGKDKINDVEEDKIIVRSNGVPTYTGKDIAYHMWRFGLLDVDFHYKKFDANTQEKDLWITDSTEPSEKGEVSFSNAALALDVVGGEQTYALDVVKKALKYLGYDKESQNLKHVNYGFVYLSPATAEKLGIDISDKRKQYGMSGRKGWGIKIDDLIEMLNEKLTKDFGNFEALDEVRNGAIKFEMLKYNTYQDLVFDLDSALDINGYSGPYVQYTHARANSVLGKAKFEPDVQTQMANADEVLSKLDEKEARVLRYLYRYPEVVELSAASFSPNLLCDYLFELSQRFNSLYNDLPIMTAEDIDIRDFRLLLTASVRQVLKSGLYLLGIVAPEQV
jgi:arginyl-tRNA synthetase